MEGVRSGVVGGGLDVIKLSLQKRLDIQGG